MGVCWCEFQNVTQVDLCAAALQGEGQQQQREQQQGGQGRSGPHPQYPTRSHQEDQGEEFQQPSGLGAGRQGAQGMQGKGEGKSELQGGGHIHQPPSPRHATHWPASVPPHGRNRGGTGPALALGAPPRIRAPRIRMPAPPEGWVRSTWGTPDQDTSPDQDMSDQNGPFPWEIPGRVPTKPRTRIPPMQFEDPPAHATAAQPEVQGTAQQVRVGRRAVKPMQMEDPPAQATTAQSKLQAIAQQVGAARGQ